MGNLNDYYFTMTEDIPLLNKEEERVLIDGIDCYTRPLRVFENTFNRKRPPLTIEDRKYLIEIMPIEELEDFLGNKYAGKEFWRPKIHQLKQNLSLMKENYRKALPMIGRLIKPNLRLVVDIAKRYARKGVDIDDLVGYGNIGLWHAAERFDSNYPVRFCTYAFRSVQSHILRGLMDIVRTVRLSRDAYQKKGGAFQRGIVSLSDMDLSDELTAKEELETIPEMHQDEFYNLIKNILTDEREREVVKMRFGLNGCEDITLERVGEKLGITKQRVKHIQDRALKKLKMNEKFGKIYRQYAESLD